MVKQSGRPGINRGKALPHNLADETRDGIGDGVGLSVTKSTARPSDAGFGWGPDTEERSSVWKGKPEPFDEVWHRRMYDMNKEIADDLSRCATVKVGRLKRFIV